MKRRIFTIILFFIPYWMLAGDVLAGGMPQRIITLSGALTEVTDALGFGARIVATDVTSDFPAYVRQLPKVSRNRSLSIEGIMAFRPDIVLAPEGDLSKSIQSQLRAAGVKLVVIRQEYSVKGASAFIRAVGIALQVPEKGEALAVKTAGDIAFELEKVKMDGGPRGPVAKVLFIYARGVGAMSVAGKGSSLDAMIQLAGGHNVVQEFNDFKPYSTEALIRENPDAILMFDFGVSSLGGKSALLKMPGMSATNAGKRQQVIVMDGPLLVNFSVRLAAAIHELHVQLGKLKFD